MQASLRNVLACHENSEIIKLLNSYIFRGIVFSDDASWADGCAHVADNATP